MKVRVEGLRDLEKTLATFKTATARNTVRRGLLDALEPMADEARRLAPDDPNTPDPDLESSIQVGSRAHGQSRVRKAEVEVYMGPTREGYPQAIMQEGGTRHHAAQPFMVPAWEGGKHALLDRVTDSIKGQIDKTTARAEKRAAKAKARG